jgi:hypothetical protein
MEEIEGVDMSLSELESYKQAQLNEAVNTAGKDVPKEKGVLDMGDTSAKTIVVPKEVPASIEEASSKDTVPSHSTSYVSDSHTSSVEEKNDGSNESNSAAPEESVEPVAVVEPTFKTTTNPGKNKGPKKEDAHRMNREAAAEKHASTSDIDKETGIWNTEVQENARAKKLGTTADKGLSTRSASQGQLRPLAKKVSAVSYVASFYNMC